MADDEVIDDEILDDDEVDVDDADLDDDAMDGDDEEVFEVDPLDDLESEDDGPAPVRDRRSSDDDDDDEEEAYPDDVEEDLDTILRDRITAGTDEEDEDEEAPVDDRTEAGDRVAPRAAEEHSCPACFLLVRRSQFSSKRTDCPGGFDGDDCPMKATFA